MKAKIALIFTIGLGLSLPVAADVLELKNGTTVNGTYSGGSPGVVRITTATGAQAIETAQIVSLTFTASAAGAPAAAVPAAAPVPAAAAAQTVTIPAGTVLMVRMMDSVSSKNKAGSTFTTKLETDVAAGSMVAIKAGTVVYGTVASSTQARRAVGQSTLDLRLSKITVNGQAVPIMTSGYQEAGKRSVGKAAKGAAAGAAIGAIAGDAGKGAAIGATAGALKKGETVTVPPGTVLEFTLSQPVTVQATP